MEKYLPYIVTVVCSIISGLTSYIASRSKAKAETERLIKKYELDVEKEREKFKMEKEKMEIEHRYQLELKDKEIESAVGNSMFSDIMKMPEVRQLVSQGLKKGMQKNKQESR